jgi:hypothetical protein
MSPARGGRRSGVQPIDAGVVVVLLRDGSEVAAWPLVGGCQPDLAVVDHLARCQLAAGRLGCAIGLRGAGPELRRLLDLVGLSAALPEIGSGSDA